MHRLLTPLVMLLVATAVAADSLESALEARAELGPAVWSRVIRIENENPASPYPARLHALVFEFDGRLWFYTDSDGTQSLSLHEGRLARDKADFGRLLRAIDPGFGHHEDMTDRIPPVRLARAGGGLRNGCFVEALGFYLRRIEAGREPEDARLLAYYVEGRFGRRGHMVLLFRERGRDWVFDPFDRQGPRRWVPPRGNDPLKLASSLVPRDVSRRPVKAVLLPLTSPVPPELFHDPAPRYAASVRPKALDAPGPTSLGN